MAHWSDKHTKHDIVDFYEEELATLRAQLAEHQASQHYRYIGADGKPVLARDLEIDRDRLRATLRNVVNSGSHFHARAIAEDALK